MEKLCTAGRGAARGVLAAFLAVREGVLKLAWPAGLLAAGLAGVLLGCSLLGGPSVLRDIASLKSTFGAVEMEG